MDGIVAQMMTDDINNRRQNLKFTVLTRDEGYTWSQLEADKLCKLSIEVYNHPRFPRYVILFGFYTKEQALAAIDGGQAFTAEQVQGLDNPQLPFRPSGFWWIDKIWSRSKPAFTGGFCHI